MKNDKNQVKMFFLSKSINEGFARTEVSAFVSQLDPTLEEIIEIKTAISEAVTNATVHAYADSVGIIMIKVVIIDDRTVEITVSDKGCGIDDIDRARQPLFTTCTTGERSGMGITIMESFMDRVKIFSKAGKGTRVVMLKKLSLKRY
jgi:stage II sporulation protein AB (anti-sigma F factor)